MRRKHFEVRFRVVEGNVEKVEAALVTLAAFDPKAGKGMNSGKLVRAEFADRDAGFSDVSWSLKSVEKP